MTPTARWILSVLFSGLAGAFVGGLVRSPSVASCEDRSERADKLRAELDAKLEASRNEASLFRGRVMAVNEERFEERNGLQSSLDNCSEKDGVARCSARTDTGAPVSYHCTVDKCEIDCSFR